MGRLEVGRGKGTKQAVIGDHLVHPGETFEMMAVELARPGMSARPREPPSAFLARIGPSGTSARHATASDPARMALARSSFGGAFDVIPFFPAMRMDVH